MPKTSSVTHFVAVEITNPQLRKNLRKLVSNICEESPSLKESITDLEKAHVTLATLVIPREKEPRVTKVFREVVERHKDNFSVKVLFQFEKLQQKKLTVGDHLAYFEAHPSSESELRSMIDELIKELKKENITVRSQLDFLHLTILNTSKRGSVTSEIPKSLLPKVDKWQGDKIGEQSVQSVQLLSRYKVQRSSAGGYYFCEAEVQL